MFLTLIMKYWKVWVPVLLVLLVAGTIFAQNKRIETLKEDRDVAVYEHDRAMEENRQLVENAKKLNDLVIKRKQQTARLEALYSAAMDRIKALSALRPDVSLWLNTRIPDGVLDAIRSDKKSTAPGNTPDTNRTPLLDSGSDG